MSNLGCVVLYEGKMLDDFLGSLKSQYSSEKFIEEYSNEREEVRDILKSIANGFMDGMSEEHLLTSYYSYEKVENDYMCDLIIKSLLKREGFAERFIPILRGEPQKEASDEVAVRILFDLYFNEDYQNAKKILEQVMPMKLKDLDEKALFGLCDLGASKNNNRIICKMVIRVLFEKEDVSIKNLAPLLYKKQEHFYNFYEKNESRLTALISSGDISTKDLYDLLPICRHECVTYGVVEEIIISGIKVREGDSSDDEISPEYLHNLLPLCESNRSIEFVISSICKKENVPLEKLKELEEKYKNHYSHAFFIILSEICKSDNILFQELIKKYKNEDNDSIFRLEKIRCVMIPYMFERGDCSMKDMWDLYNQEKNTEARIAMLGEMFKRSDIEIDDFMDLICKEAILEVKQTIEEGIKNRAKSVFLKRLLNSFEKARSIKPITIYEILAREIANRNDIEPHVLYNLYKREERDSVMRIWAPKLKEMLNKKEEK